jgi:hypothetical protein
MDLQNHDETVGVEDLVFMLLLLVAGFAFGFSFVPFFGVLGGGGLLDYALTFLCWAGALLTLTAAWFMELSARKDAEAQCESTTTCSRATSKTPPDRLWFFH